MIPEQPLSHAEALRAQTNAMIEFLGQLAAMEQKRAGVPCEPRPVILEEE
jgi:hypothetical protein